MRLLIGTSHRLYGELLAGALAREPGCEAEEVPGDSRELYIAVARHRPGMIILDACRPGALEEVRVLTQSDRRLRVLVLGLPETGEEVLAYAEAGMAAFLPPDAPFATLLDVLAGATRGELRCSPKLAGTLLQRVGVLSRRPAPPSAAPVLSRREREVAALVAQGLSNKEIAQQLHIGLSTVKVHVHNLLGKLGLQRRAEIARWQWERGAAP
jgi:DNA-binding NarL/FixJ family response regulator